MIPLLVADIPIKVVFYVHTFMRFRPSCNTNRARLTNCKMKNAPATCTTDFVAHESRSFVTLLFAEKQRMEHASFTSRRLPMQVNGDVRVAGDANQFEGVKASVKLERCPVGRGHRDRIRA